MKHITDFEIISHGVEHAQYFQGCGVSFTRFDDVATGCGMSEKEALDDALESLAQNNWDTSPIDESDEYRDASDEMEDAIREACEAEDGEGEPSELYCYVSVRVKEGPDPASIITYTLPAYWASYIINGDASGLEGEREVIDAYLEKEGNPNIVDCGESYFSWRNDATNLGGDVCEYTALLPVKD